MARNIVLKIWKKFGLWEVFSHEPMTTVAFFRLFENDAVLGEGAQCGFLKWN